MRATFCFLLFATLVVLGLLVGRETQMLPADFAFNNGTEISSLDPAVVTGVPEGRVLRCLFEGLVIKHPKTLAAVPGMAESWSISEDGCTYTFNIRRGAKWTNGDAVTAHDFVFSWERFLNPATAAEYSYQLWYVEGAEAYTKEVNEAGKPKNNFDTVGIRATDDYTFEVRLKQPTPYFLDLCGFYPLFPVNKRNLEEAKQRFPKDFDVQWMKPENLVTNGPYTIAFRRINDRIRLVKNPDYWDADNIAMNSIDVFAIENYNTGLNLYLTGQVHWIDRIPAYHVVRMKAREDFNPLPYLGIYFYRVNVTKPPFDDVRIRQALCMTIPRQSIVEKITRSGQVAAYSLVPTTMPEYSPAQCEKGSLARARELIAEAGFGPDGKELPIIEILYNTSEAHRDIAELIAAYWQRELGLKVKLLNQEWKVYLNSQSGLDFDVSRSAWISDYLDPNSFLNMFVSGGKNNKTGWSNTEFDRLIRACESELDRKKRMQLFAEAERILMDELPILPVYYYATQSVVNPRLGGYYANALDEHFPKFWYWKDDAELNAFRQGQKKELIDAPGPREGLYSPAQMRERAGR